MVVIPFTFKVHAAQTLRCKEPVAKAIGGCMKRIVRTPRRVKKPAKSTELIPIWKQWIRWN
ncbi:hypothetical protein [Vandammella animalimorsus]|uniref:hypothetical protein n=1 Tax=Vandammella animalimorsus TaxID=2029117 RepID=UPI0011788277|nr:hypothetical protein [Vandammella animalimorsus]